MTFSQPESVISLCECRHLNEESTLRWTGNSCIKSLIFLPVERFLSFFFSLDSIFSLTATIVQIGISVHDHVLFVTYDKMVQCLLARVHKYCMRGCTLNTKMTIWSVVAQNAAFQTAIFSTLFLQLWNFVIAVPIEYRVLSNVGLRDMSETSYPAIPNYANTRAGCAKGSFPGCKPHIPHCSRNGEARR